MFLLVCEIHRSSEAAAAATAAVAPPGASAQVHPSVAHKESNQIYYHILRYFIHSDHRSVNGEAEISEVRDYEIAPLDGQQQ